MWRLAGRLEITGGGLERDWRGDWRLLEGVREGPEGRLARRLEITVGGLERDGGEIGGEIGDYCRGAREGVEGRLAGRLEITGGGLERDWRGDW